MSKIIIDSTEFLTTDEVVITGLIDDATVTKIDLNGSEIPLVEGTFSIALGVLAEGSYVLNVKPLDGDSKDETLEIAFSVKTPTEGNPTEGTPTGETPTGETPSDSSNGVSTDDGKYSGVTENENVLKDNEFYNKIMENFGENKFIPDYIPSKPTKIDFDKIQPTLGAVSLFNPIETLDERFPVRRNLEDKHEQLFGDRFHPDAIKVDEKPVDDVDRFTAASIGTSGFTL